MFALDEKCFQSNVPVTYFQSSDMQKNIRFFMWQRTVLLNMGFHPASLGVYLEERKFILARLNPSSSENRFGNCYSIDLDESETIPEAFGQLIGSALSDEGTTIFNKDIGITADGLTVITRNRLVTEHVLEVDGLDNVVGMPNAVVPHINAVYGKKPIAILTGNGTF